MTEYQEISESSKLPPHIYATAHKAFTNLFRNSKDQSVIISGESGAGKTEATKLVLQYIVQLSGKESPLEHQVLEANPIIESFGNAKTVRNNNSSRFGKWIELYIDPKQRNILGLQITNYLLEKSRVVQQAVGERNYHIFYQLLSAINENDFHLSKDPTKYNYLNKSNCIYIDSRGSAFDMEEYQTVLQAMKSLNFSDENIKGLMNVMASILHLGNVKFGNFQGKDDSSSEITNPECISCVSNLLQMKLSTIQKALTIKTIQAGSESIESFLKPVHAGDNRDALCKNLYSKCFDWITQKINSVLQAPKLDSFSIGILDIFGFEDFESNYFEQFCINFANEKLQNHFNAHIFTLEQEEYKKEGVDISSVEFIDNQPCLDLIEKNQSGIISLIDEVLRLPKTSDQLLLQKLSDTHGKNSFFQKSKTSQTQFTVVHYAGRVLYQIAGFLEKNRDTVSQDLLSAVQLSSSSFLKELFFEPELEDVTLKNSSPNPHVLHEIEVRDPKLLVPVSPNQRDRASSGLKRSSISSPKKVSIGSQFRIQLSKLIAKLNTTEPHFVRCLKSTMLKRPNVFDSLLVLRQLRYLGLQAVCEVRKTGYPVRISYESFFKRYSCLLKGKKNSFNTGSISEMCKSIAENIGLFEKDFKFGLSKVFLRNEAEDSLDREINQLKEKLCVWAQARFRGRKTRKFAKTLHEIKYQLNVLLLNIKSFSFEREDSLEDLMLEKEQTLQKLPFGVLEYFITFVKLKEDILTMFQQLEKLSQMCRKLSIGVESFMESDSSSRLSWLENCLEDLQREIKACPSKNQIYPLQVASVAQGKIKQLRDYESKIQEALLSTNPNLAFLEGILQEASSLKISSSKEHQVRSIFDRLKKRQATEIMMLKLLEDPSVSLHVLQNAMDDALHIGFAKKDPMIIKINQQIEKLSRIQHLHKVLEAAISTQDLQKITEALAICQSEDSSPEIRDLYQRTLEIKSALEQKKSQSQAESLLNAFLRMDLDSIDEKQLMNAAERAKSFRLSTDSADRILSQIQTRKNARDRIRKLLSRPVSLAELQEEMKHCSDVERETSCLLGMEASQLAELIGKFEAALTSISVSISNEDPDQLEKGILQANTLHVQDEKVMDAQNYLDFFKKRNALFQSVQKALITANFLMVELHVSQYFKEFGGKISADHQSVLMQAKKAVEDFKERQLREKEAQERKAKEDKERNLRQVKEKEEHERKVKKHDEREATRIEEKDMPNVPQLMSSNEKSVSGYFDETKTNDYYARLEKLRKMKSVKFYAPKVVVMDDNLIQSKEITMSTELDSKDEMMEDSHTPTRLSFEVDSPKKRHHVTPSRGHEATVETVVDPEVSSFLQNEYSLEKWSGFKKPEEHLSSSGLLSVLKGLKKNNSESFLSWLGGKNSIPTSLTHLPGSSITYSVSALNKMAIKVFSSIQGFMKDRSVSSSEMEFLGSEVLQLGLFTKELRDEIYAQVIKQLRNNPNKESLTRGWHLLSMITDSFNPSTSFGPHIYNFISTELTSLDDDQILQCANASLNSLVKRMYSKQVKLEVKDELRIPAPLSPSSLAKHRTTGQRKATTAGVVTVHVPGGNTVNIEIQPGSSIKEMLPMILSGAGIRSAKDRKVEELAETYGIYETDLRCGEHYLHPDRCLLDFRAATSGSQRKFVLRTYLLQLPVVEESMKEETEKWLILHDIAERCRRCEYFQEDSQVIKFESTFRFLKETMKINKGIGKEYASLQEKFEKEVQDQIYTRITLTDYFQLINSLPLLGAHTFTASQTDQIRYPTSVIIAINYSGVFLLTITMEILVQYFYEDIAYKKASSEILVLKVKNRQINKIETFYFQTRQGRLALHIMNSFIKLRGK